MWFNQTTRNLNPIEPLLDSRASAALPLTETVHSVLFLQQAGLGRELVYKASSRHSVRISYWRSEQALGLETIELILLAEEHFHLEMTDQDTQDVVTVAECAHLICRLTQQRGKAVSRAEVSSWLVDTLVAGFGINPDDIHAEARFVQDLGLD